MSERISRRNLLRMGLGGLALPMLGSVLPARVRAGAGAPPQRLLVMTVPNGWRNHLWHPTGEGAGWQLSPCMLPLEPVRNQVLCLSGLDNRPGIYPARYDEHTACEGVVLTSAHRDGSSAAPNRGWSVDQVIADQIGGQTAFPSLQLGSEEPLRCYTPGSCPGFVTVSWRGMQAPMTKDTSVSSVFNRVFGGIDPAIGAEERARRLALERSLLDGVRGDLRQYASQASSLDRRRLDQYTTGLRELEHRLELAATQGRCDTSFVATDPEHPTERLRAMADLIALALQCDQTRVVSWMLGTGRSERSLAFLGYAATHHELSHETGWDEAHIAFSQWQVDVLRYTIEKLASVPESDGSSLLDHTTILFVSGIGESTRHDPLDMNVLLAGGGLAGLGERRVFPEGTPLANLHVSLLQRFGVEQDTFGDDGTGSLLTL
jgi:hypothetical protein